MNRFVIEVMNRTIYCFKKAKCLRSNEEVFLWNRTLVAFVDKLSSTTVDFIRSEEELKKLHLIWVLTGSMSMLRTC